MQISTKLEQYQNPIQSGSQNVSNTTASSTSQTLESQLTAGKVFEGTINEMRDGQVLLGLSNGQTILAKLEADMELSTGQSLFFQVKANDGNRIQIAPFTSGGAIANPTLLSALDAASLPVTERNVQLVDQMMLEQMSIDRQSLGQMARLAMNQPGIDVETLVQMTKLNLPVTVESASQFENYKMDQSAMLHQLESLMEEIPELVGGDRLSASESMVVNHNLLDVLLPQAGEESPIISGDETVQSQVTSAEVQEESGQATSGLESNSQGVSAQEVVLQGESAQEVGLQNENPQVTSGLENHIQEANTQQANVQEPGASEVDAQGGVVQKLSQETGQSSSVQQSGSEMQANPQEQSQVDNQPVVEGRTLSLLGESGVRELAQSLSRIPQLAENGTILSDGGLNPTCTPEEILTAVKQALESSTDLTKDAFKSLFQGREYQKLVGDLLQQEWLMTPESVKDKEKVSSLYERLNRQMNQLEQLFNSVGKDASGLTKTTGEIRSNMEFMNQVNQMYNYVQIPLKLANQNAHSDLYVYTNKKAKEDPDGELSAFLHLDLDHLGSTDVSVKMKGKKVSTQFYLSDDQSFQLVMAHTGELEQLLSARGYECSITVENKEKHVNLVEDFLNKDTPAATGGMVHRYSFDVKA